MVGITSFGAYLPWLRLNRSALGPFRKGQTALANFDEDSLTLAVAAAIDCLSGMEPQRVDGLYLATTTPPYAEKQTATTAAVAAGLRPDVLTADFGHSLRASTAALRAAADAVAARTAEQVLVVAADTRLGRPGSAEEMTLGHGAGALLLGRDKVVAALEASHSVCHEILDVWRPQGSPFVRSWEKRFAVQEGYDQAMTQAVAGLFEKTGLKAADFKKAVFPAADAKSAAALAKRFGFDPQTALQDLLLAQVGQTGTAQALMLLGAALEEAAPGDRILLANYGQGADAFVLAVTEEISKLPPRRGVKGHLASKHVSDDYRACLLSREILPGAEPVYPVPFGGVSAPALYRETDQNLRLLAAKCQNCGTVQYPPQRICVKCRTQDKFETVSLSDKRGRIFSYAMDHVSSAIDLPAVVAVVDFEGGGRLECLLTDREVKDIALDLEVEMTFRRLFRRGDIVNYCWKARPCRV
ncbi:MAG: OB-fold domain-containing protein [Deltaproteobacteria bacterium]|nr:OB-fold domain-containing protein [Deltaproteobacteria bacterium]